MKVFHNKSFKIEAEISQRLGLECYVPKEKTTSESPDGKKTHKLKPAISGLLFVRTPDNSIADIKELTAGSAAFYTDTAGKPAIIPRREMDIFKLVTLAQDAGLEYLSEKTHQYTVGQHVKVLQGPFAGAEGHICRIRGNRRLVVSINGICAVATSYIPACFLEKTS